MEVSCARHARLLLLLLLLLLIPIRSRRTHLFLRILWRIATESSGDASRKEYEGGSESDEDVDEDGSSDTPVTKTPKPKAE